MSIESKWGLQHRAFKAARAKAVGDVRPKCKTEGDALDYIMSMMVFVVVLHALPTAVECCQVYLSLFLWAQLHEGFKLTRTL